MINVSSAYKKAMNNQIRDRAYISVGIGIINQNAQEDGKASGDFAYWSQGSVFDTNQAKIEYATLEEDFFKTDGSMFFVPENNELIQLNNNGLVTSDILSPIRIDFSEYYALKGLTINFGSAFPTEFMVETSKHTLTYTNDSETFITMDALGDTNYITITPISMVGGQQRFRIQSVLMGVGLAYSNKQTKNMSLKESVSSISDELPNETLSFSFYDEEGRFDIDDENSFIDYLETMQQVTVSFGVTLENGTVEWNQIATMYLKDWKSQKRQVSLTATDRLAQMEDEYSLGNKIYERTAYSEAESIFADAGLEPDEYFIDEYLNDVILNNPMPVGTHKSCLQLLANACRCIIRQDENGKIMIKANFANVLDPEDLKVEANGVAEWANLQNVLHGSEVVYTELTQDFMKTDGSMYFLPEDNSYLKTSYVSEQVSDENGLFEINPSIAITLPAAYSYFGLTIKFDGNPPQEMIIHIYNGDTLKESTIFTGMTLETALYHEFLQFDKMVIEFTKGYPNNRVLINKISFGDLSDYVLTRNLMMENPIGYKEKRVKAVKVKIFSYQNDEEGKTEEIEGNVFATRILNEVGEMRTLANPLVSTEEHAELLAEWLGNYYANNISYDVKYRGEPRINASDIIHMESEKLSNLQVEITSHSLSFNGAFSGSLELRRALKMMED